MYFLFLAFVVSLKNVGDATEKQSREVEVFSKPEKGKEQQSRGQNHVLS